MYEVLIKLEKELEYKKYTIDDLRKLKELLEGKTVEEIRAKNLDSKPPQK